MLATSAHAGAWLQPDGETLAISTTDWTLADTAFGDERDVFDAGRFRKIEQRIYTETGLTNNLTLTSETGFQTIDFDGFFGPSSYSGPSAIRLGARAPLLNRGRHRVSFATDVGYQRGGEFISDGELGYEGYSGTASFLYGYGWNRAYVDVQAGYRYRFGLGPDTWRGDATAGYDLSRRWSLSGGISGRITDGAVLGLDELLPTESVKAKAAIQYRWNCRTRFELGGLATTYGRNQVRERGLTLGLWRSFGRQTAGRCLTESLRGLERRPLHAPEPRWSVPPPG